MQRSNSSMRILSFLLWAAIAGVAMGQAQKPSELPDAPSSTLPKPAPRRQRQPDATPKDAPSPASAPQPAPASTGSTGDAGKGHNQTSDKSTQTAKPQGQKPGESDQAVETIRK